MKKMFSVIFMNFWGYDLIIFIVAVLTAVMYFYLRRSAEDLYNKMHLTVFVPDGSSSRKEADNDISGLRETELVQMRNHTGKLYSIFVNLTGIFPLLGILGTVVSLLGMVADSTDITGNFYGALTSTFWGLVFAIIYKFLDGIVSARIEDNEKSVALFLERNVGTEKISARREASNKRPRNIPEPVRDYDDEESFSDIEQVYPVPERGERYDYQPLPDRLREDKGPYSVYDIIDSLGSGDDKR
ncbi:MAG: MotA/TolQ/ExbB proton channel family protein [Ruminococcus sp.]|nr:MotA/TolQ/ExbB proton channel family protein [Ruminococcus sp.]